MIPFAIDDTTWGTILWLDTPSNLNKYSRSKLTAAAYASFRPTDAIIQKFYNSLLELSEKGEITPEECYMLRTQPSARRSLLRLTQNDETRCLDSTPLEIIKQYKNAGYQQGIDEKNQEIAQMEEEAKRKINQLNNEIKSESERADTAEDRASYAELNAQLLNKLLDLGDRTKQIQTRINEYKKERESIENGAKKVDRLYKIVIYTIKALITLSIGITIYFFGRNLIQWKDWIEFVTPFIIAAILIWGGKKVDDIVLGLTDKANRKIKAFIQKRCRFDESKLNTINQEIERLNNELQTISESEAELREQQKQIQCKHEDEVLV